MYDLWNIVTYFARNINYTHVADINGFGLSFKSTLQLFYLRQVQDFTTIEKIDMVLLVENIISSLISCMYICWNQHSAIKKILFRKWIKLNLAAICSGPCGRHTGISYNCYSWQNLAIILSNKRECNKNVRQSGQINVWAGKYVKGHRRWILS